MKSIDKVSRVVCIPYVDKAPKRHTWYLYHAKVGTTCSTLIWVADRSELNPGDHGFKFIDDLDCHMNDKSTWVKYPSDHIVHGGYVDEANDWLLFVSKI